MEFIHDRSRNIPFSLHDSRVKEILFQDHTLTLKVDKLFQYTQDGEMIYSADLVFHESDLEECSVLIFNKAVYAGEFSGKAMGLKEFIENYSGLEFEILTEGYFGYCTTYIGWFWEEGKEPVSGIMNIWNTGDMVYRINK